jgi:hypothetical protein
VEASDLGVLLGGLVPTDLLDDVGRIARVLEVGTGGSRPTLT